VEDRSRIIQPSAARHGGEARRVASTTPSQTHVIEQVLRHARLPAQPTVLIGRERELENVRDALQRADVRMLTLTGPAGVGKTRLAVDSALQVLEGFPHGVVFIDLAPITDPTLVLSTVARTLGVRETADVPLLDSLATALRDRRLLLVLDNFEHVLDAAPRIAELLGACPQVEVLASSRAPLRVRWEHEVAITPLAVPQTGATTADEIARSASVQLFVERVRAIRPNFQLTDENAGDVAEICSRLDGLPLAIELVAARVRTLPPATLRERLAKRLDLLTGGPRDLPARQQTLRDAIDWSYHLLSRAEQGLFRRLAVFVSGCTLEAAETVCAPDQLELAVLNGLSALVEHSLLLQTESQDGTPRYHMLELVREYALELLSVGKELDAAQRAHALHFLAIAERAHEELKGHRQHVWLDYLEEEHDNFRAALGWSLDAGEVAMALRLSTALARFWIVRGYEAEGWRWLTRALAAPGAGTSHWRARTLLWAGNVGWQHGKFDAITALVEESLPLLEESGDRWGVAVALNHLGVTAGLRRDMERCAALLEESLALFRQLHDRWGIAMPLQNLGMVALARRDLEEARTLFEEAARFKRETGDLMEIAHHLGGLADVALLQDKPVEARTFLLEALDTAWNLRALGMIPGLLPRLAEVAAVTHDPERAARLYGAAEALREATGIAMRPYHAPRHESSIAEIGARLGEQAFARAWAEGRTMPLEEVIAYAMREGNDGSQVLSDALTKEPPSQPARALPAGLTRREVEVLRLLARGRSSHEIAEELVLSVHTVTRHISNIYGKIDAHGRADATAFAIHHGLVDERAR
jgi:predicted ATPase/DNA-binding CsgD family transcriptional regulator